MTSEPIFKDDDVAVRENLLRQNFDIIIPAYNEEKRIGPVLEEVCYHIRENGLPWKVTVSIDGNDGTEDIVSRFSKNFDFVQRIKNKSRGGYGGAIKRGIVNGNGKYAIVLEADGAIDFKEVVQNLHYLKYYDIINFDRHSGNELNIPFVRRLASRGYNIYIKVLLGLKIRDIQGGYKVFKMDVAKSLFRQVTITDGFFQAALFYHAKKMGLTTIEVNVPYRHRDGSKFGISLMILGGFVSGVALRLRNSRFYKFVPKNLVELYYRKFKWI